MIENNGRERKLLTWENEKMSPQGGDISPEDRKLRREKGAIPGREAECLKQSVLNLVCVRKASVAKVR